MTGTAVALVQPRLPMPQRATQSGMDPAEWAVLTNVIFPGARNPEVILLAREYCRVRQLDILKKPVNIVPQWDSRSNNGEGGYVDQIWPSINEVRVTAARTNQYAGLDAPVWGEEVTRTFKGRRKIKGQWEDVAVTVKYPKTCAVTVYRLIGGVRCGFTSPVHWEERYGRAGGGELPSDMWAKAPHDQLQKNAEAASLRAAFPEEGPGYDESEVEGATILAPEPPPEATKPRDNWQPPNQSSAGRNQQSDGDHSKTGTGSDERPAAEAQKPAAPEEYVDPTTGEILSGPRDIGKGPEETWITWCQRFLAGVATSRSEDDIKAWGEKNQTHLDALNKPESEGGAPKVEARMQAAIGRHRMSLSAPQSGEPTIIGAG